jgi:cytoskeletal protein CcmA (bactofilin family)
MDDKSKNSDKNNPSKTAAVPAEDTSLESTPQAQSEADLGSGGPAFMPVSGPPPKQRPNFRYLFSRHNRYLLLVAVLIIASVAAALFSLKFNNDSQKNPKKTSLTDQQLSELKGSTTVVGDPQQILDVQSNSVFEGQVLIRNNLDVAGSIKVGGPLSLSSVTVGGTSSFGNVGVNGNLTVNGATVLQGTASLQKNLAVAGSATFGGTVSAGRISVSTLQLTGDLVLNRHIIASGGLPGRTNGSALGSGGTASVNGSDAGGTVTVNTGGGPPAGCFISISFRQAYNTIPHVIISPSNSSSAGLNYYTNRSPTGFSVCTTSVPAGSTTYLFDYVVFD